MGRELRDQGYEVTGLGLDIKRTSVWRVAGAVRRFLKAQRPDILHTHLYHPNLYGRLGALGLGLSGVVAAVHNSYTRVKLHRRAWNFLLARATDRVLVGSPQVWQDVRHYDGVPASRLQLLPYGIPFGRVGDALEPGGGPGTVRRKGFRHREPWAGWKTRKAMSTCWRRCRQCVGRFPTWSCCWWEQAGGRLIYSGRFRIWALRTR